MGFRDDREASVQRIEVLERELVSAKQELEAALLRAIEVDDLRKRVVDLTAERDALRRLVEPARASSRLAWRIGVPVTVVALALGGVLAYQGLQRRSRETVAARILAESQRDHADAELEAVRHDRDAARAELAAIDSVTARDLGDLQRQLNTARMHETGPALLVTAHVVSRSGNVPAGATDECTLAIRSSSGNLCAASVTCGPTEVFPLVAPPDVICTGWTEGTGRPVSLVHARAGVRSTPLALFEYDADARTIDVRETAANGFTLHMRVDQVLPYQLR